MPYTRSKEDTVPEPGPGLRSGVLLTHEKLMQSQEELRRIFRAEFQLYIQTSSKKQLRDKYVMRREKTLAKKARADSKDERDDIRVSDDLLVAKLRTETETLGDRLHSL